jgi:formylglycine-generating enzyme required for sulfatase activity
MTGNVSEWVSDWYEPNYYQTVADKNISNPTGPDDSPFSPSHNSYGRVFRGGSWRTTNSYQLSTTYRSSEKPDSYADDLGFRCVLPAKP